MGFYHSPHLVTPYHSLQCFEKNAMMPEKKRKEMRGHLIPRKTAEKRPHTFTIGYNITVVFIILLILL